MLGIESTVERGGSATPRVVRAVPSIARPRAEGAWRLCALLLLVGCSVAGPPVHGGKLGAGGASGAPAARSIVLVTVDSLRRDSLRASAPGLGDWARGGTRFEAARSPASWAMPSVATLLTGLEPARHHADDSDAALPAEVWTLAEVLQCEGMATASFYANGFLSDRFGFVQGWDAHTNYIREARPSEASAVLADAQRWIGAHAGERYLVHAHLIDPHPPYDPPPSFSLDREGPVPPARTAAWLDERLGRELRGPLDAATADWLRALYEAEVASVDAALAPFLETLPADVLVVVTASDAEAFGEGGGWAGADVPVAREVPLIMAGPRVPHGRAISEEVRLSDVAPTVLELLDVAVPARVEGRSLVPVLTGKPPAPRRPGPTAYPEREGGITRELCEQLAALGYIVEPLHCERYPTAAELAKAGPPARSPHPCASGSG